MVRGLEKMVDFFSKIVFNEWSKEEINAKKKKESYVISSVFPSTRVMKEVEKHI